ncbi:ABC transporter permease [Streptomyces carpaticus]|uniref:ABC transporter permease n=1 Tax=Streptomyces carpaticus TaxID=285558 RepID=A0ABV4ZU18_9ACTN
MLTRRQKFAACRAMAHLHLRGQLMYRGDFLLRMLGLLIQVALLALVWRAIYPEGEAVSLETQIAYVTYAAVQNWAFTPPGLAPSAIPQRVREGSVVFDLARPLGFPAQMLSAQAGVTAALLPFALLALPFAILVGGAQVPASAAAALASVVSLVPALLNALLLAVLVSMVCFWTLEMTGIFMIHRVVAQFFAGALVPLWLMPHWLAGLAHVLPFQTITYTPVALYLGRIEGTGPVLGALAVQLGWTVALWLLLRWVWARAHHRVVVQGG